MGGAGRIAQLFKPAPVLVESASDVAQVGRIEGGLVGIDGLESVAQGLGPKGDLQEFGGFGTARHVGGLENGACLRHIVAVGLQKLRGGGCQTVFDLHACIVQDVGELASVALFVARLVFAATLQAGQGERPALVLGGYRIERPGAHGIGVGMAEKPLGGADHDHEQRDHARQATEVTRTRGGRFVGDFARGGVGYNMRIRRNRPLRQGLNGYCHLLIFLSTFRYHTKS